MDIKRFFYKYILRRQYYRYGKCNRCGDCCTKIYIRHKNGIIKEEKEFEKLRNQHPFYAGLMVVETNSNGVLFMCRHYNKEERKCNIHKFRTSICRKYPSEEILKFNAYIPEQCGYHFEPIDKFSDVLKKAEKKSMKF